MEDFRTIAKPLLCYKVREYHKNGPDKGNVKNERFFQTLEEADDYYSSVFVYADYSLNPTVWHFQNSEWNRLSGY